MDSFQVSPDSAATPQPTGPDASPGGEIHEDSKPMISVVVCTYNYAQFIGDAIRSVQSQTYPHWECIIVDDASSDETSQVVAALAGEDPRIRYFRNARNLGVGASRNLGNSFAAGDWIAVLDADDWWEPEKLRLQIEALRNMPGSLFCFTSKVVVTDDKRSLHVCPTTWLRNLELGLRSENLVLHSSVLISKKALMDCGGYDERLPSAHDWDLYLNILRKQGPEAFVYVDLPLSYYRIHGTSISAKWHRMIVDERKIVRRYLAADGWAIRHPRRAIEVIRQQLYRESIAFELAGERNGAIVRALLLAIHEPYRRWRWQAVGRLISKSSTSGVRADGSIVESDA